MNTLAVVLLLLYLCIYSTCAAEEKSAPWISCHLEKCEATIPVQSAAVCAQMKASLHYEWQPYRACKMLIVINQSWQLAEISQSLRDIRDKLVPHLEAREKGAQALRDQIMHEWDSMMSTFEREEPRDYSEELKDFKWE